MGTRATPRPAAGADRWFGIKTRIHAKLLTILTPEQLRALNKDGVREQLGVSIERIVRDEGIPLNAGERDRLIEEVLDEVFGLGPLEALMKDMTISDIMVNGPDSIYVERFGKVVETSVRFKDTAHVRTIVDRIVSNIGRRIDDSSPIVDARLGDGSRVCAVIPPISLNGPVMSIRRFGKRLLTVDDLIRLDTFTPGIIDFLAGAVKARLNIVVSGGSGSGKTTMLNTLSRFIREEERVVTIEDTAELQMQQEHLVRLETRPINIEGAGAITQRDLVINALRMRPDRIIIGECRGAEAMDMMQAMNTGHDGSMTTTHANTGRDAFSRLETMVMMASSSIPDRVIRQMLASAVNLVVHCARLTDGTRKIVSISEVAGMTGDELDIKDIFLFEREGISAGGRVLGHFRGQHYKPVCADRIRSYGVKLDDAIYDEVHEVKD
jgi:pilus assembly protein CpaF